MIRRRFGAIQIIKPASDLHTDQLTVGWRVLAKVTVNQSAVRTGPFKAAITDAQTSAVAKNGHASKPRSRTIAQGQTRASIRFEAQVHAGVAMQLRERFRHLRQWTCEPRIDGFDLAAEI